MWPWIEERDSDDVLVAKAEALAAAPRRVASVAERDDAIDPRTAPLVAQRLCVKEVPLAPGRNSAAYVGWLGSDMGQTTTVSDARSILQANAFRDWLWVGTHEVLSAAECEAFGLVVGRRAAMGFRLPLAEIIEAVRGGRVTDEHRRLASRSFPDLDGRPGLAPTEQMWREALELARLAGRVADTGAIAWSSRGL